MVEAEVTQRGMFDMQVCVPGTWSDEDVKNFADREYPCGTDRGWFIRRAGDAALQGEPERTTCGIDAQRVHIMLDA